MILRMARKTIIYYSRIDGIQMKPNGLYGEAAIIVPFIVQDFWRLNSWQHVVATVNDSGLMKLYRDGELKGSFTWVTSPKD